MPGSGWPRPYKLNGGFIGFLSRIALCALVGVFYWSFASIFCFLSLCFCGSLCFLFLLYYVFVGFCLSEKEGHGIE